MMQGSKVAGAPELLGKVNTAFEPKIQFRIEKKVNS